MTQPIASADSGQRAKMLVARQKPAAMDLRADTPSPAKPAADKLQISAAARFMQQGSGAATAGPQTAVGQAVIRSDGNASNGLDVRDQRHEAKNLMHELKSAFHSSKGDDNYNVKMDFNQDGMINSQDLGIARDKIAGSSALAPAPVAGDQTDTNDPRATLAALRSSFHTSAGDDGFNAAVDFNKDGVINSSDLGLARARMGGETTQPVKPAAHELASAGNPGDTLAALRSSFHTQAGDDGFNAAVDFNQDGVINSTDLGMARARIGGETTQPVTPAPHELNGAPNPRDTIDTLRGAFHTRAGDDGFNAAVDFNKDGVINSTDLGMARARMGGETTQPVVPAPHELETDGNPRDTLAALRGAFHTSAGDDRFDASVDLNDDGVINSTDLGLARARMGGETTQPVPPTAAELASAANESSNSLAQQLRSALFSTSGGNQSSVGLDASRLNIAELLATRIR